MTKALLSCEHKRYVSLFHNDTAYIMQRCVCVCVYVHSCIVLSVCVCLYEDLSSVVRYILIHPSNNSWIHHPLASNAHFTIIFHASLSCAFLIRMYISSLHHSFTSPSHSLLVFLLLLSFPTPRTPPALPVCYLPCYRCVQISLISFP